MARKIPAEFVPLSVNYDHDRAIVNAGPLAEVLFVRGMAYARRMKSDGHIPDYALPGRGIPNVRRHVAALVREELWIEEEGGWLIRSWVKWNRTLAEQAADAAKKAAGAAWTNHRRWHAEKDVLDPTCDHCATQTTDRSSDQYTESQEKEERREEKRERREREERDVASDVAPRSAGGADAPTQTLIAEWIDHCDTRPPSRVIGQVSKEIKNLLDEGQPYADVRTGLAAWARKGLHPSTLASVVHETRTVPARPSAGRSRFEENLDVVRQIAERDGLMPTVPQIGA